MKHLLVKWNGSFVLLTHKVFVHDIVEGTKKGLGCKEIRQRI